MTTSVLVKTIIQLIFISILSFEHFLCILYEKVSGISWWSIFMMTFDL